MDEKQIAAKRKYAGERRASMKRRDDYHDYAGRRMYMITLEVEGRLPLFGRLMGDAFASVGSKNGPRIELTELGKAVQREWLGIHDYYPQIEVKAVQMMPDHLHGILFVKEPLPVHLGQVISGFKAGCRKAQRVLEAAQETAQEAAAKPLPTEKEALASQQATALPLQVIASPSQGSRPYHPLFAKGYNDLILRSYDELPIWLNYLRDNPRRLLMKHACPQRLRPFFGLVIGSHSYCGIGNRDLLVAPKRKAVRLSRRLNDSEIEAEVVKYLAMAKDGVVLVSPAISPGEKRVMRAIFDAGFPTIVLMENGFTSLSKPHGEQFYACAEGRLLMLSPFEHHNERKKITASQCQQLNLMALEICE